MTAPETPLVQIDGLRIARGSFTLEVPRWSLQPGRVVGLVGANGAGKTTLLRHLAGLSPRTSGSVRVCGHDPARDPGPVRALLGFMSDDLPVFDLRADRLLRTLSGYYPTWDEGLVETLVERFELDVRKRARDLSKGQAVRLRLICALAWRPRLVVLDEPAAGLDLSGRRRLLETVLDVVQDPERSVIVSSHMLADVERIADELLVLRRGKVVAEGSTPDVVGEGRTLEEALLSWEAA